MSKGFWSDVLARARVKVFAVPVLEPTPVQPLRGRVHKVSIVAGGEVSVVVRFGIDEPRARGLNQGTLLEVFESLPIANKGDLTVTMLNDDDIRVAGGLSAAAFGMHKEHTDER